MLRSSRSDRVLAIAYAFDICSGFDPCQVRFDHRTIRTMNNVVRVQIRIPSWPLLQTDYTHNTNDSPHMILGNSLSNLVTTQVSRSTHYPQLGAFSCFDGWPYLTLSLPLHPGDTGGANDSRRGYGVPHLPFKECLSEVGPPTATGAREVCIRFSPEPSNFGNNSLFHPILSTIRFLAFCRV